jgi:uncharacterized protein
MFFDPRALLVLVPPVLAAVLAHWWTRSVFRDASRRPTQSGATGSEAAAAVLNGAGIGGVFIEDVAGQHLDHYAPAEQGVLLRPEVHDGANLMAVGIAGHEAAHAIQDADRHSLLGARTFIVLAATCGSLVGILLFVGGFVVVESMLIYAGIAVFTATVLAQLFNLPVEFDASRRARGELAELGLVTRPEAPVVKKVLSAAALTYVAATLSSVLTLAYFLFRAGVLGSSQREEV